MSNSNHCSPPKRLSDSIRNLRIRPNNHRMQPRQRLYRSTISRNARSLIIYRRGRFVHNNDPTLLQDSSSEDQKLSFS
jgi:hypothetical protein